MPSADATAVRSRGTRVISRYFFVGMALLLTVIVFFGFWPTYFGSVFLGQDAADFGLVEVSWPIHFHAAIFAGWMGVLLAQTTLVARGEVESHMRLGRFGAAYGFAVVLVGIFITFIQMRAGVATGRTTWSTAPLLARGSWTSIGLFAVLLGVGYTRRNRPAAHKRYMLLATVGLVRAANARIADFWLDGWSEMIFLVPIGPVWMLLWVYDLYAEQRIHPATLVGTGILFLGELLSFVAGRLAG